MHQRPGSEFEKCVFGECDVDMVTKRSDMAAHKSNRAEEAVVVGIE